MTVTCSVPHGTSYNLFRLTLLEIIHRMGILPVRLIYSHLSEMYFNSLAK
jgi:hypothetical protein